MPDCRFFVDAPHDGAWNMAMDEVLLNRAATGKQCQLRLYGWRTATLSLGYFQSVADRLSHRPSLVYPLVRRPSGGGAIVHDREITYSLAVPGGRGSDAMALYQRVHAALSELLAQLGARATIYRAVDRQGASPEPLLCFQRRSAGDVLVGGHKVIGSAQRRGRGAILQQGSILLDASPAAPELLGITDLTSISLSWAEWSRQILACLVRALDCTPFEKAPTEIESDAAANLVKAKYGSEVWNRRR
jgi:lipoate-protein ligase A